LKRVPGIGTATIGAFRQAGYRALEDLEGITEQALTAIPGVGPATAEAILDFLASPAAEELVQAYKHSDKRKNIPPAGLAAHGKVTRESPQRYHYDPHLPPVLRFDDTGEADRLPDLLRKAEREPLDPEEARLLAEALRDHQPWLEWAGKREKRWFDVDPVSLHIHERASAQAIIKLAEREPLQPSLFADPRLDYRKAIEFYRHDVDWANRLILGDSLVVMHSLARREDLAGKVQMIYVDPPYGIKFRSNFQPFVTTRRMGTSDKYLTREPEQVKAYRDTWRLGVHSYLAYLRDRLMVARELLTDSGSIFVQISDENLHRIRAIMDEVFGPENFVSVIAFKKTSGFSSSALDNVLDFIIWYAKSRDSMKFHALLEEKDPSEQIGTFYDRFEFPSGERRTIRKSDDPSSMQRGTRVFQGSVLYSDGATSTGGYAIEFEGQSYTPPANAHWKTNQEGMSRLLNAERIYLKGRTIRYVRYFDDYPHYPLTNVWTDTSFGGFVGDQKKIYVVQTYTKVIERCMLMTTDPGDLVLDPTCGSGTAAYVGEQWGRRWITIDTSRVAIALARQRLLTAKFDYYKLADREQDISGGLAYKKAAHITLGGIANNTALDPVFEKWEPVLAEKLKALNGALSEVTPELRTVLKTKLIAKERREGKRAITEADERRWLLPSPAGKGAGGEGEGWEHWEVPFDTDPDWPEPLKAALEDYRKAWRAKMDEVNETIAASAPSETLYDQPEVVPNVLRVSGPFTVEGVQPAEETFDTESPIGGAPEELETFPAEDEPANAEAYLEKMIHLLRHDGVRFPNNKVLEFQHLEPLSNSILHAEGEWSPSPAGGGGVGEGARRVAVAFGPQYGPITAKQVEQSLREAYRRGYDDLVFAGFTIDGAAQAVIQEDPDPQVRCHLAHIRPDVNMGDLLKDTPSSQLFTVFGLPRVKLQEAGDGEWIVEMEGVDIYDPVTNTIQATEASKVAAWFLDSDYDGRTFCITQAFFPDSTAWRKLARALKSVVDPQRFAAFSGTTSLPFEAGEHQRIAVKVIDPRGNEVMRVMSLGELSY
jgi:adenine-specific DNA-methyltransferase